MDLIFALTSYVGSKISLETPPPRVATFENDHSKDENYVLANEWMVETFNNAESVIQFTDKESGTVRGNILLRKGLLALAHTLYLEIHYLQLSQLE